jgi:hypothetical protein
MGLLKENQRKFSHLMLGLYFIDLRTLLPAFCHWNPSTILQEEREILSSFYKEGPEAKRNELAPF